MKPQNQIMGQLPFERVSIDCVFSCVGIDYAGSFYQKLCHVCRPTIAKPYDCLFVSLSVKTVHIEVVSDLSTDTFIMCLRRFISQRGKLNLLWSDYSTNFVGVACELRELKDFLAQQKTQKIVSEFCTSQHIKWKFIPKCAPHFGRLWEAAVKCIKTHLRLIVSSIKLTYEELTAVLAQVECCLNSRPLVALPSDNDRIELLTPGHFLIGHPLEAHLDSSNSYVFTSLLCRWHLHSSVTFGCVGLVNTLSVCGRVISGLRLTGTLLMMILCFSVTTKWYPPSGHWPVY